MNLEELYIQRNEYARQGDIENVERITKEIEDMLPTKPKQVLTIDGKPAQFEIIGIMNGVKGETFTNGNDGRAKFYLNDKGVYARILIRRK